MRSPLYILHMPIVLFMNPDAKYSPFGENTMLDNPVFLLLKILIHSPVDSFHRRIIPSLDLDAKYSPLGENTALKT